MWLRVNFGPRSPLTSYESFGKCFKLCRLQFSQLENGDYYYTLWGYEA